MTKKDFIKKWNIDDTSVYYYKKKFPVIAISETTNFALLDKILEERVSVKEKVKTIMKNKKPKDVEFLFDGKNKKTMSHNFVHQLFEEKSQICVRDSNYKKYLTILKHFGVEHENISS